MKRFAVLALLLGWSATCLAEDAPPRAVPRAAAFAPDGRSLAVGSKAGKTGEVTLWDVVSRKPRWTTTHMHPVRDLVWTPDGKTLLAAVGPSAVLIDPETGKKRGDLGRHGKDVSRMALTADGHTLAMGDDEGVVILWDVAGGKEKRTMRGHRGWIYSLSFAPDGKRLASTANEEARLWDPETGKMLYQFKHNRSLVRSAVFTPDGKAVVTAGWDGTARLWDVQSGDLRARFGGRGGLDGALLPADAHTLILWGHGRTIALFDLDLRPPDAAKTRRIALLIEQLDADGYQTRESASWELKSLGWIASTALRKAAKESQSAEVRIRARAALTALETEPRKILRGHTGDLRTVCSSKDGKMLASGGEDGTVRLWDRATGKSLAALSR